MIGLLNADPDIVIRIDELRNKKSLDIDLSDSIPSNLKGLYIDWIKKPIKVKSDKYAFQAAIINKYVKRKIPIVIFDRYMCISNKEYKWLSKYNVHFFEPALNNRKHFEYLPFCLNNLNEEFLFDETNSKRSIDLGFKGNRHNDSFDKFIVSYIKENPTKNVVYDDENIDWNDVKWTIAIDDKYNYDIGYLNNNVFDAMKCGCAIFIPMEHKYFIGMSYGISIDDNMFMDYFIENFTHNMRIGTILSTYETIKKIYPEFTINNIVDKILSKMGG